MQDGDGANRATFLFVRRYFSRGAVIPRLDVPYHNYWSEASHGFFGPFKFRPMDVTSYSVCLAMSQSWDREKIKKVTSAIADECRAYNNIDGDELNMWGPTINLARDPRNGRSDASGVLCEDV